MNPIDGPMPKVKFEPAAADGVFEMAFGHELVKVDAAGFSTDDAALIAALDAQPGVKRAGAKPKADEPKGDD